jgi:pimeloyl-ACP methyl ester carboxylesterase
MGVAFLDDVLRNLHRLDLLAAASRLEARWLIVHGLEDETVPFEEAEALRRASGRRAALLAIDGAGHTFGAVHPFAGPTPHLTEALETTLEHLLEALAGPRD